MNFCDTRGEVAEFSLSRKAAVVGAGLAANGGKGGARPRMAVTWSFKDAGLACEQRKSGRPPLHGEWTAAAAVLTLPSGKGRDAAARAVSTDHNLVALIVKRRVE